MAKTTQPESTNPIKLGGTGALGAANAAQAPKASRTTSPTKRVGVGLKQATYDDIERIARDEGVAVNAVMKFACEWFVSEYERGPAKTALDKRKKTRVTIG